LQKCLRDAWLRPFMGWRARIMPYNVLRVNMVHTASKSVDCRVRDMYAFSYVLFLSKRSCRIRRYRYNILNTLMRNERMSVYSKRVLLIEDEEHIRVLVSAILRRKG